MPRRAALIPRAFYSLLLIFSLAACVSPRAIVERPLRSGITRFSFEGNAVVRQGERAWRVGVSWDHRDQRDEVLFSGPLGQGLAQLRREGTAASLTTADHKTYAADDADALAREILGLPLPVVELPHWLLGDVHATQVDALGRPQTATDGPWQLVYREYESARADALPSVLELRHDDIELILHIDQWELE